LSGLTYNPAVFAAGDLRQAMDIILTPEDSTTEERWRTETGYLADLIESELELSPSTVLLDYGCGIGRLAKELIARTSCSVVGVDITPSMRLLAPMYVQSERFVAASPDMLDTLLAGGLRCDAAISVWVLQHCHRPAQDVALVGASLKPGARLLVVNNSGRAVPTLEEGWIDDGIDIRALLAERFDAEREGRLAAEKTTPAIAQHAFWARLRAR
jgi:SAM-dependent methyltransferase